MGQESFVLYGLRGRVAIPVQYGIACFLPLPCLALRLQWPWHGFSFFLFIPAVLIVVALFGKGPALLAAGLSSVIAIFFWLDPIYSFRMSLHQIPPLALYALACAGIVGGCEWLRTHLQRRRSMNMPYAPAAQTSARLDGIDFWRGIVLVTIFVNHVPGNIFEMLTHRNFGFSDSAEAFVFLSGVSLALAYGHRFQPGSRSKALIAMGRRVVKLYGVHVALSLAAIAIFSAGAIYWKDPALMTAHGRGLYISDTDQALVGILSLGHQLGYFNILPLYIVLILTVPVLLWLAGRGVHWMLIASALLYAATRLAGWNLPTWPQAGTWFLNPFAWQFVMAIGIAAGLALKRDGGIAFSPPILVIAVIVLLFGLLLSPVGSGALQAFVNANIELDTDKSSLGLTRLGHFLALAYVIYALGLSRFLRDFSFYEPFAALGRHSLLIFAVSSILSAIGQVLFATVRKTAWFDLTFFGVSLLLLYVIATLADTAVEARRDQRARLAPAGVRPA